MKHISIKGANFVRGRICTSVGRDSSLDMKHSQADYQEADVQEKKSTGATISSENYRSIYGIPITDIDKLTLNVY